MYSPKNAPFETLDQTQNSLLGYLAMLVQIHENLEGDVIFQDLGRTYLQISYIAGACAIVGIPDEMIDLVRIRKIFTGLRNHNKLESISYYE